MKRRTFLFGLFFAFLTVIALQSRVFAISSGGEPQKVKYVFLFIGDGMGLAQVNLTQGYLAALENRTGLESLNFTIFPQAGLASNYANNQLITCSAAAATALATGHKTNIGRISMDTAGIVAYETIAEKARKNGFKVGIVTSVSIDQATPAAFYAHQPDRNMFFSIGQELAHSNFDFFAGGGFMKPDSNIMGQNSNLVDLARANGYNIIDTRAKFDKLVPGNRKTLVLSPRTAGEASLPFYIDIHPDDFTLSDYTSKAISMLDNDQGFFLMVEGGKIDWACHANDAATLIKEVIAFDDAVARAVAFYDKHPDETLIVVTADHETGGLALGNRETGYDSYLGMLKYQKSSVEELDKIVAQFRVTKSGDTTAEFSRMLKIMESETGLNSRQRNTLLTEVETASLKNIFKETVYVTKSDKAPYTEYEPFIDEVLKILATRAGISWASDGHTFVNVPVYAIGPGSELFSGYIDNTDIPKIIGKLSGIEN